MKGGRASHRREEVRLRKRTHNIYAKIFLPQVIVYTFSAVFSDRQLRGRKTPSSEKIRSDNLQEQQRSERNLNESCRANIYRNYELRNFSHSQFKVTEWNELKSRAKRRRLIRAIFHFIVQMCLRVRLQPGRRLSPW